MSAPAFTPGPWEIGSGCDGVPAVCVSVPPSEGTGFVVAHINRIRPMSSVVGNADANARLIAAAPDMYEALRAMVYACCSPKMGTVYELERALPDARAAIAKARGEP